MEKPKEERQTTPQTIKPKKDLEKETQPKTTNPRKQVEKETQLANTSKPKDLTTHQKELEKQPKATNNIIPKELEKELEAPKTIKPKEYLEKKKELPTKRVIWDCESSLYDSFELKSFEKQLDSAIISSSARTLSMPHLSDHHRKPPVPLPATTSHHHDQKPMSTKKPSKLSRSIHKLLRSVFRPKQNKIATNNSGSSSWFRVEKGSREGVYYVYDTSGALTTIPEGPETVSDFDGLSPDLKSFVRRTASDRFAPASLGISCA